MKVSDLNNEILLEQNFRIVFKELSEYIKQIENDIKEVNLNIVKLMVEKTEKSLNALNELVNSNKIVDIASHLDTYIKKLNFFKDKFNSFLETWKDNVFQKEIMDEASEILKDLIKQIDYSISTAESKIKINLDDITNDIISDLNNTDDFVNKNKKTLVKKKIARGIAQDLDTRKFRIHKQH